MTAARALASLAAVVAAAAAGLVPTRALADPAVAEALFREGRRLLDEGKTDEACLKLAESQAQDPSSGTLLNLALCHETQHKLATAWSEYVSAGRLAREQHRADRAAVAEKKAAALEPRLPRLTVTSAAPVAGLQIALGVERLGPGLLGSAVPVDPGSYAITASAPGRRAWGATVDVAESESRTVQVPDLEPEAPPPGPAPQLLPGPPAIAPPVPPAAPFPDADASASPSQGEGGGPLGWIVGVAGVAVVAAGAGFGVASLASYHDATSLCPSHANCSADAMSARSSAEWKAWVSNVAIGVGAVGVGVGGWILLTGKRGQPATRMAVRALPGLDGARVTLERTF